MIVLKNMFDVFYINEELDVNRDFFLSFCHFSFCNNVVTFRNNICNQLCGIGMGTNYKRTAANLFIFILL